MTEPSGPSIRRRWERWLLRTQGRLDSDAADRLIPWIAAAVVFSLHLALSAAALRALDGGSGLAPWLQAAWRRANGGAGTPVGGLDPARGSGSLVAEPILWLTGQVPAEVVFTTVQAAALGIAVLPLWRLSRDVARLRVGAAVAVICAFALAPALHRANLGTFHPELVALPALLWAYLRAHQGRWLRYWAMVALVLACRADLGLTVAAMGVLLITEGRRRPGIITAVVGFGWTLLATVVIDPSTPEAPLTPAGEFVARATGPLAAFPRLVLHPIQEAKELLAEPSVLFLVVVLAPLLFLPLVSVRRFVVALPCLVLAMIADRAVQRVAQADVLNLSPAAAHIGPALAFVFVALVFALERMATPSVTRVNVDRRLVWVLLVGATLLFVTESPTSPYRHPWAWGSRDVVDGARMEAADRVAPGDVVAASPTVSALVAERAHLIELPTDPGDLTRVRIARTARSAPRVDVVLLDTSRTDPVTGLPDWSGADVARVVGRFDAEGFSVVYEAQGIVLLERPARQDDADDEDPSAGG